MANNVLSATITVDGNKFTKTLGELQEQLKRFEKGLRNASSVESFNRINRAIDVTKQRIASLNSTFNSVTRSSNQATGSLINFGRVIQDAPYGFIGIANNLNPLFEGFARLKEETGSTGAAFKSLGKDLLGAGGISLGISLVSSALVLFGDKLFGAGKKAKEAADSNNKLKESIDGVFSSVAKEATEVSSLVSLLRNETETRERKLAAIKELQRIQPDVFEGLRLEGEKVIGLDNAYKNYLANLKTVIAVKIKQAQLEKAIERQLKAQGVTLTGTEKDLKKIGDAYKKMAERARESGEASGLTKRLDDEEKAASALNKEIQTLLGDIEELSKGITLKTDPKKNEETEKSIIARAKRIYEALKEIIDLKLTIRVDDDVTTQLSKARDFLQKYFTGQYKLTIPLGVRVDEKDVIRPQEFKPVATSMAQMFGKEFDDYFGKTGSIVIDKSLEKALNDKKFARAHKAMQELAYGTADAFNKGLQSAFEGSFSGLAEGIGKALASGDIKNAMAGFASAVGDAVQAMGRQFISLGVAAILAKQSLEQLFTNPFLAIAAGAALTIAGAALKASLSNFGGFRAAGGPVAAGQGYIVGERGPEWFQPGVSGRIIPNHAMGSGSMSMPSGGKVVFEIQGNKLVGVLANTNRYQGRNT